MIFSSFSSALGQLSDARFRRVALLGILLALALLWGTYAVVLVALEFLAPQSIVLPLVGPIGGLHSLLGWGSLLVMILLSPFLMIPVASAFSGLFIEDVAQAVEDKHYPGLAPVTPTPLGDAIVSTLNFTGVLIAINLLALILYLFAGPLIPLLFWAINGYLLGREYFLLVATRRLGATAARQVYKQNKSTVWAAGILMAAPLSVPLVNLVIPILGVATFTHLFHRLNRTA
jgi:uncharacterized protein involved in cysteine biosynthesis